MKYYLGHVTNAFVADVKRVQACEKRHVVDDMCVIVAQLRHRVGLVHR